MWIVRLYSGSRRPYTFVVMAMLIVILGVFTIFRMPTDIFPDIDIPVISVIWNYGGLAPDEMEKRIVSNFERNLTTVVNDIEHTESQTLGGVAVVKIFFQPGAKIEAATATQITAISQTSVRVMPPGTVPPFIIRYSASNVPILQTALESDSLSEQQLFDYDDSSSGPTCKPAPSRARRSRGHMAASNARSWWTSTPSGSSRAGCRLETSTRRSGCRTSSCRAAPRRSAVRNTPSR